MKKPITIMAALAALLSTSCSDDMNNNDSYVNQTYQATDADLTKGVNVFLCSQDTISNAHVPLAVNTDVVAVPENSIVSVKCVHDSQGNNFLQPSLISPQDTTVTTCVKLTVPNHEDMNKTLIVSIRPSELVTRAATKDQVHERLTDVLSYGVYGDLLPGEVNVLHPALNVSALKEHVENHQNFRMDNRTFKSYGTSIKEVSEDWSLNVGIQTPGPQLFRVFKGAFNVKGSNKERHEKEYLILDGHDYRAYGLLDDETATTEANSDAWIDLLSTRLNDLLHNPKKYESAYPLNEEGTMNLIAAFGSHISTQVLLGSGVRYETSKTIDAVENSFGIGISIAGENRANAANYDKDHANITTANAKEFLAKAAIMYATGGSFITSSGSLNYEKSKKDYAATTDQKSEIITIGNGSFNGERWVADPDPSDWQLLGYGSKDKTMRPAKLIPLYALISETAKKNNKDVERRYELLKEAIEAPSENSYPKYLSHFGKLPEDDNLNSHYVICDFVVKTESNINGEPFSGLVKCKDNQTRKVMYYPLRWSDVAGDVGEPEWRYCTFDAARNTFINLARTPGVYTHFYYAIIQDTFHDGLDGITFVPEESNEGVFSDNHNRGIDYQRKGWVRRTIDEKHCGSAINGPNCDKVVPYIHYNKPGSGYPAISAVCLFEDVKHRVLASSAGTEYDESNALYTENYKTFWNKSNLRDYDTTYCLSEAGCKEEWYRFTTEDAGLDQTKYYKTKSACAYGWYRAPWWAGQIHHIYVGYSFRKLPTTVVINDEKKVLTALAPKAY